MLQLHTYLSVDALTGQPLVNVEACEAPAVDLQEVCPELCVGRLLLVEVDRSHLPDRGLKSRIRLVHVLHRRLDRHAAAPELLEHQRVLRARVHLPLVHEQREQRAAGLVKKP